MIAKRIEFSNASKSRFSTLVEYITNAQRKNERVGEVRITHCKVEHPTWAAKEVEAVQAKNHRTKMDKTYHLLVSFRAGDHPSPEVRHAIETRICEKLGYSEHQRISAVHYDTDHMHIHIAINKIHPVHYRAHEPYFDKKCLGIVCAALEKEFNLAADNHVARMTPGEAKAQDMEKTSGIESLIGWIKRGCLPDLLAANTWEELHAVMANNSLALSERANGLVITAKNGIATKASSLHRNLSKTALEKRLGVFQAASSQDVTAQNSYAIRPMASSVDTRQLWALYQHERRQQMQQQLVLMERAKHRKDRRMESARKAAGIKRLALHPVKGRLAKALLYHTISDGILKELHSIQQDYRQDRSMAYVKGKQVGWYDWLKAKAWEGNAQALEVLRHRYSQAPVRGNAIGSDAVSKVNYRANAKIDTVTKRGTLHYQIAHTVLRDDGKVFRLSERVSDEVVAAALQLSVQRFGRKLAITGTDAFLRQAIAVGARLNITFTDPVMEQQRLALLANKNTQVLSAEEAATRYIAERNDKRLHGIDILPHRRYAQSDAGNLSFAGLRQIEGQQLMLLHTSSEMLVLSINYYEAKRAQRLSVGNMVDVTAQGILRARSRGL